MASCCLILIFFALASSNNAAIPCSLYARVEVFVPLLYLLRSSSEIILFVTPPKIAAPAISVRIPAHMAITFPRGVSFPPDHTIFNFDLIAPGLGSCSSSDVFFGNVTRTSGGSFSTIVWWRDPSLDRLAGCPSRDTSSNLSSRCVSS